MFLEDGFEEEGAVLAASSRGASELVLGTTFGEEDLEAGGDQETHDLGAGVKEVDASPVCWEVEVTLFGE